MTKARTGKVCIALVGLALTLFINYHKIFFSNWNLLPGDVGDSRLLIFILEHWFNVFKGHESFFHLNMFFPDKMALGYSDALFLFSIPYSTFRLLGFDIFTSFQLVFFFMTSLGYFTSLLMFRNTLNINYLLGIAGAVLIVSLNAMQVQVGHGQLLGFYFYPLLILLIFYYFNAGNIRKWIILIVFSIILGLLFFTSYYSAWYFLFSLAIYLAVYLLIKRGKMRKRLSNMISYIKESIGSSKMSGKTRWLVPTGKILKRLFSGLFFPISIATSAAILASGILLRSGIAVRPIMDLIKSKTNLIHTGAWAPSILANAGNFLEWASLFLIFAIIGIAFSARNLDLHNYFLRTQLLIRNKMSAIYAKLNKLRLFICFLIFIISLVPFFITYVPVLSMKISRTFEEELFYTPHIGDIVNVSSSNYFWTPILNLLHFNYGQTQEVQYGSPPMILAIFFVTYFIFLVRLKKTKLESKEVIISSLATLGLLIYFTTIQVNHLSIWYIVHKVVPGAYALRAMGRYFIVLNMIIVATAIYFINYYFELLKNAFGTKRIRGGLLNIVLCILITILIGEQFNASQYQLNKAEQITMLEKFKKPELNCNAFYLTNAPKSDPQFWRYQIDAMMIAMNWGISTINGYSAFSSNSATRITPSGRDYELIVMKWLREKKSTKDIYKVDYNSGKSFLIDVDEELAGFR